MKTFSYLIPVFLLLTLAACDSVSDHDEHPEAEGLRLVLNGVNVYQVQGPTVSCDVEPCGIEIPVGEETALITAQFLDLNGDVIPAGEMEDALRLVHTIRDPSIATFEQHDEDGRFRFHLHGEEVGQTTLQLELFHDDHADFRTPPVADPNAVQIRVRE